MRNIRETLFFSAYEPFNLVHSLSSGERKGISPNLRNRKPFDVLLEQSSGIMRGGQLSDKRFFGGSGIQYVCWPIPASEEEGFLAEQSGKTGQSG